MSRPARGPIIGPTAIALIVLVPLLSGCLRLPESGPLVTTDRGGPGATDVGPYIDPAPPQPGESPPEIVKHFLDAMMASSLQTSVARQFLTREAQANWDPKRATITYVDATQPSGSGTVILTVTGANRLDASGAWLGSADVRSLSFPMVVEDGEWRIAQAPDALIVPQRWFELRFRQVALHFFDPTAEILVPEPVYVPRGEQLATSLVRGLLAGPRAADAEVSRTFLPSGARLELSVPISDDGVAEVALEGDPSALAPEAAPMALAQLAWTLRQDPEVRSFRLTIGDERVSLPQGTAQLSVDYGADYDPTVVSASPRLFGLRAGLISPATTTEAALSGPLSGTRYGLREFSVNLTASRVAGVTTNGQEVLVADADEATSTPQRVFNAGQDLAKPAWDFADRLWLLDRRRGSGAVISVVVGDVRTPVAVPGVSGGIVKSFLVSRDGSRLVAVLDLGTSDAIMVSRILHDDEGNVVGATRGRVIAEGTTESRLRVSAIGWRSAIVLTLAARVTEDRDELLFLSIDGGPSNLEAFGATRRMLPERILGLTTSPVSSAGVLVTTESGVQDPFDPDRAAQVAPDIEALTYVG
jgi:Lipoprotein LpqB beta-propeller domain/Sporulation and spore germination